MIYQRLYDVARLRQPVWPTTTMTLSSLFNSLDQLDPSDEDEGNVPRLEVPNTSVDDRQQHE